MSEIGPGGIAAASVFGVALVGLLAMYAKGFSSPREPGRAHQGGTRRKHRGGNRTRKA
jgi:hypothetical protein